MSKQKERIQLTPEQRTDMKNALISYFETELETPLGNLGAELLLKHILEHIAPAIYNQGVRDAGIYLMRHVEDLPEIEI